MRGGLDEIARYKIRHVFCFLTGIITGAIIGAIGITCLVSYRIDIYHKKIAELETSIQDRDARLEQLEKSMDSRGKLILKDIKVVLDYDEDKLEFDNIALEKHIKDKYKQLVGKEVRNIDIDLVAEVVDKRIFRLDGEEFKLKVTRVIVSETLKLWITVESAG